MSGEQDFELIGRLATGVSPLPQPATSAAGVDLTFRDLYAIRDQVAALTDPIAGLLTERRSILAKPPHTDDLVATYRQGIEAAAAEYEQRVAAYLTAPRPDDALQELGVGAALYFMRDLVAGKAPALIERLCPDAKGGLKAADRRAALAALGERLQALRGKQDALRKALIEQRQQLQALLNGPVYQANDVRGRAAIESQMLDLPAEIDAITQAQAALDRELTAPRA